LTHRFLVPSLYYIPPNLQPDLAAAEYYPPIVKFCGVTFKIYGLI